jgi:GntR family transcriptional regulator
MGRRIGEKRIFRDVQRLTSFTEDIRAARMRPGGVLVRRRLVRDARVGAMLGESRVVELVRVRTADGRRICIENTFLPASTWPLVRDADLTRSLYGLLEGHGERLATSRELLEARMATASERRLLGVSRALPVVSIARLAFDGRGRPREYTENVLRADRYLFAFALRR